MSRSSWHPQAGDVLTGRVHKFAVRDGGQGVYPLVEVRNESGRVVFHAFKAKREVAKLQRGDIVSIKCVTKDCFKVDVTEPASSQPQLIE